MSTSTSSIRSVGMLERALDRLRALGIAVRTVKGHVSNILSKLRIADRTQAAVLAWKRGVARKDGS